MSFKKEPEGYEKTALSDLQGSWEILRDAVVDNFGFPDSEKLLFHIDEAMSWESVRNLKKMESTWLLIRNITVQSECPEEVLEWVGEVKESLDATFEEIAEGSAT
jgi:hypothetical protein